MAHDTQDQPSSGRGNSRRVWQMISRAALILCAALFLAVPVGAWFSSLWESSGALPFVTDEVEYPPIEMWTYLTAEENTTAGWEKQTVTPENDGAGKRIPTVSKTETSADVYSFTLSEFQLGTIDNLLTVKDDNTVFFRVTVDRAHFGDRITLDLAPVADHTVNGTDYEFELYNGRAGIDIATPVEEEAYTAIRDIADDTPILTYAYCVTTSDLVPSDAGFADMVFVETDGDGALVSNTDLSAGTYYLYLKITPNLPAFVSISKSLINYMPCVLLMNLRVQMSFENRLE